MGGEVQAVSTQKEQERRAKTYELFVDEVSGMYKCEHTFMRAFAGKVVLLCDNGSGWAEALRCHKDKCGMVYLLDTGFGKRLAFIATDGTGFVSPAGEYINEFVWHSVKAACGRIVIEEVEPCEEATCAELAWRMLWEAETERDARKLWQTVLANLLWGDCPSS